ncbi:putative fungal pheromoneG-protein-coupled receptor [Flagelloscypha sp. PMI_526]|nr:putative fungal pheromoneG-protein-coupled receptor [Flagelloscypha sp. PMI_526]
MADFPSSDPAYPLFSIFAFLGFVLPLIPVTWQLQAWNTGAVYYVAWSSLSCLNFFVNSLVWKGNAINVAPVWCDISTRLMIGASVGLPAASLCINRRLYSISRVQVVTVTKKDKLRNILIDTCICVLFPIIYIALQFVVQGHRFNIFEDYGCVPSIVNTIPTFFIFTMWPLLIGIISAIYCVLSLWQFTKHRYRFTELLAGSQHANLTPLRYFRLMALACTELAFTIPLSIFIIWLNANATPISPWTGFSDAHFNFSRVETFLAIFWRSQKLMLVSMELTRWLNPFCSFVFFAFFGFGEEAMSRYRFAYNFLAKKAGLPSAGPEEKQRGIPSLSQLNLPKMSNDSSSSSATIIVPPSSWQDSIQPSTLLVLLPQIRRVNYGRQDP